MARDLGTAWWQGTYLVQRECTCARGQRSAECSDGWHTIDSHSDPGAARADARALGLGNGVAYRVVERATGRVLP